MNGLAHTHGPRLLFWDHSVLTCTSSPELLLFYSSPAASAATSTSSGSLPAPRPGLRVPVSLVVMLLAANSSVLVNCFTLARHRGLRGRGSGLLLDNRLPDALLGATLIRSRDADRFFRRLINGGRHRQT